MRTWFPHVPLLYSRPGTLILIPDSFFMLGLRISEFTQPRSRPRKSFFVKRSHICTTPIWTSCLWSLSEKPSFSAHPFPQRFPGKPCRNQSPEWLQSFMASFKEPDAWNLNNLRQLFSLQLQRKTYNPHFPCRHPHWHPFQQQKKQKQISLFTFLKRTSSQTWRNTVAFPHPRRRQEGSEGGVSQGHL